MGMKRSDVRMWSISGIGRSSGDPGGMKKMKHCLGTDLIPRGVGACWFRVVRED